MRIDLKEAYARRQWVDFDLPAGLHSSRDIGEEFAKFLVDSKLAEEVKEHETIAVTEHQDEIDRAYAIELVRIKREKEAIASQLEVTDIKADESDDKADEGVIVKPKEIEIEDYAPAIHGTEITPEDEAEADEAVVNEKAAKAALKDQRK